jgi:hypothetical protein
MTPPSSPRAAKGVKQMKTRIRFLGIVLLCAGLLSAAMPQSTNASNPYYSNLKKWNYILYQVNDYNQTAGLSYFTDTNQSFTIIAHTNSHILYEYLSIGGKGPSPYDPNNIQAYGNFYFGNLTRSNVTMYEIASNLALSIYPWFPGFLTSVNWTRETQQAQAGRATLGGTLQMNNKTENFFGISIPVIEYDFKQTNHFQNTNLTYSLQTGALLSANTIAGNYKLQITALSTDISVQGIYSSPITPLQILASLASLTAVTILATRRRKL